MTHSAPLIKNINPLLAAGGGGGGGGGGGLVITNCIFSISACFFCSE